MNEDTFRRVSICGRPIEVKDDVGHVWTRVLVEYQSGPAYGCQFDMDEINDLFILRDTIDRFIQDNNIVRENTGITPQSE